MIREFESLVQKLRQLVRVKGTHVCNWSIYVLHFHHVPLWYFVSDNVHSQPHKFISNSAVYDERAKERAVKIVTEMSEVIENSTTKRMLLWQKLVHLSNSIYIFKGAGLVNSSRKFFDNASRAHDYPPLHT